MSKHTPRERKHKRRGKESRIEGNANAEVILPISANERDERKRRLQLELEAQQPNEKISSKKRKRLEHYIETKLKREENADLIKKIAAQKIDTSLLQSSKKLGRVTETRQETFRRALRERDAGVDVLGDQDKILFQPRRVRELELQDESQESVEEDEQEEGDSSVAAPEQIASTGNLFGVGLKRSLDGTGGAAPVIVRRKRRKKQSRLTSDLDGSESDGQADDDDEESSAQDSSSHESSNDSSGGYDDDDDDDDEEEELDEWNGFA